MREGDRKQVTLLPESRDDYIAEDNPVRAVDAFVEDIKLKVLGFAGAEPAATGRPSHHPAVLLQLYPSTATRSGCRPADGWSAKRSGMSG